MPGHRSPSPPALWICALAVLLWSNSTASPAKPFADPMHLQPTSSLDTTLEFFFEAELTAEGEIKPFVVADDPFDRSFSMSRDLVAQGNGSLRGPDLAGTITWSMLVRKFPEHDYGRTHVTGWLETADGAEIFFRATGYVRGFDTAPGTATYNATLTFEADLEPEYEWLNSVLAIWQGSFDADTKTFRYRAYVPIDPAGSSTTKP